MKEGLIIFLQTVRGVFTVVTFSRGLHAMFRNLREGQGFAAYSREARLRDPLPLGVFDTVPRLTFTWSLLGMVNFHWFVWFPKFS